MADAQQPELRGTAPGLPDEVALDQPFRAGELYTLRAAVAAHASELGGGPDQVEALMIVASELATNAILHGGGRGQLRLWSAGGRLHMRVSDHGKGIPDPGHAGLDPQEPSALGGRGLWIARQLCDDVAITAGPTGTAITVSLRVSGAPVAPEPLPE